MRIAEFDVLMKVTPEFSQILRAVCLAAEVSYFASLTLMPIPQAFHSSFISRVWQVRRSSNQLTAFRQKLRMPNFNPFYFTARAKLFSLCQKCSENFCFLNLGQDFDIAEFACFCRTRSSKTLIKF